MATWKDREQVGDLYRRAKDTFNAFLTAGDPDTQQRLAESCAQSVWHLRDWIATKASNELLANMRWTKASDAAMWFDAHPQAAAVRKCRDLANASKHGDVTKFKNTQVYYGATASAGPMSQFAMHKYLSSLAASDGTAEPAPSGAPSFSPPLLYVVSLEDDDPRHRLADGSVMKVLSEDGLKRDEVEPILRQALAAWEVMLKELGLLA